MIPPSRKLIGIGSSSGSDSVLANENERTIDCLRGETEADIGDENSAAMVLALLGDMAFMSMYVKLGACEVAAAVSFRSLRRLMALGARHASSALRAVAIASRGGTMLRMISASATNCSSDSRAVICDDLIRSRVCWLEGSSASIQHMRNDYLVCKLAFCPQRRYILYGHDDAGAGRYPCPYRQCSGPPRWG